MRYLLMSLFLVFASLSAASATETVPADVVPSVVSADAPAPAAGMHLERIAVEERATQDDAAAAQFGPRGGFWWMVAVVVVAGVILAVLL